MDYYPLMLNLKNKECLVVGAGKVGLRKIDLLTKFSPKKIVVVDPLISEDVQERLKTKNIEIKKREFKPEDLEGKWLVIASTNDHELNLQISNLCREKNILCNIVDRPDLSSFIVPATIVKENLVVAVSTSGTSPALAKKIRDEIAQTITEEYLLWIKILKKLRPFVLSLGLGSQKNKKIFHFLTSDEMLSVIKKRDKNLLKEKLKEAFYKNLNINDVTDTINAVIDECLN